MNDWSGSRYRVYAKIIGYVLPKREEVRLYDCVIKRMSLAEQRHRRFKAIESGVRDPGNPRFHKSYITLKSFSDPRFIKTQYVIYSDVEVRDENAALGLAVKRFDRVCGCLALTATSWFSNKTKSSIYKGYEYQLSRVYELKENEEEIPVGDLKINGGWWSMINHPANKYFQDLDFDMLARMLVCRDETFNKSFKYLLQAEKDFFLHIPPQMLVINLFKCIELIVDSTYDFTRRGAKRKKRNSFRARLSVVSKELGLTKQDELEILNLKKARDDGDVAHSKRGSRSEFYPPQFPVPGDVDSPNFGYSGLISKALLLYFMYVDSLVIIKITSDKDDKPGEVVSVNYGKYYETRLVVSGRKKEIPALKRVLAEYFEIPRATILLKKYNYPETTFQIKNHLKIKLDQAKPGRKFKLILFPFSG